MTQTLHTATKVFKKMGRIKVFPFFPYLILVIFICKSTIWCENEDYFDLLDDTTPNYYHPTYSAQELVDMNITPDISNDIDIDICKASEYNQHSIFLKFNRYHN